MGAAQVETGRGQETEATNSVRTVKLTACNLFLAAAGLSRVLEVIAVVGVSAVNICHPNRLVTISDSLLIKGTHAAPPQP